MSKIMLVEDDNNLREIYEARLLAEGYEIVSAKDGEEALAMAVKEKPDLIISDVMMPKISGFDMLDILRSSPETKNTKVIMMTALSQAEDKSRADKLGADRYLVKSQVTLEDVAKVAKEVLEGEDSGVPAPVISSEPVAAAGIASQEEITVVADEQVTDSVPEPITQEPTMTMPTPDPTTNDPITVVADDQAAPANDATTMSVQNDSPMVDPVSSDPITSTADTAASETAVQDANAPTQAEESAQVEQQIDQFAAQVPTEAPEAVEPVSQPIEVVTAPVESTEDAANNAAILTDVVNDVIDQQNAESATSSDAENGKKVISPINDLSAPGPDLAQLAAQEEANEAPAADAVAPAEAAAPAENTVIAPQAPAEATEPTDAPTVVTPTAERPEDGLDPNSVAL